jgi:hypothetical protein
MSWRQLTRIRGLAAAIACSASMAGCITSPAPAHQAPIVLSGDLHEFPATAVPRPVLPRSATQNASAGGAPLTRADALALTAGQTNVVLSRTRSSAKLTTWGTYVSASGLNANGAGPTAGYSSAEQVWLVSVSGEIRPPYAHGAVFPWAVFVYDAATGTPLGMNARAGGNWPPYFDSIPELSAGA